MTKIINNDANTHYYRMVQRRHINQRPFDKTVCDDQIANGIVIALSLMMSTVCDGVSIKYDLKNSCVCDVWQTVGLDKLFVIR